MEHRLNLSKSKVTTRPIPIKSKKHGRFRMILWFSGRSKKVNLFQVWPLGPTKPRVLSNAFQKGSSTTTSTLAFALPEIIPEFGRNFSRNLWRLVKPKIKGMSDVKLFAQKIEQLRQVSSTCSLHWTKSKSDLLAKSQLTMDPTSISRDHESSQRGLKTKTYSL